MQRERAERMRLAGWHALPVLEFGLVVTVPQPEPRVVKGDHCHAVR